MMPDIYHILMSHWFKYTLYLDPVSTFPETTERPGYFVGFADNIGNSRFLKITWSQFYMEAWFYQQQMQLIGTKEYHLSLMYKNQLNY
jgi:hypothetical protein